MRHFRNLLPTDDRWLAMTAADIIWEYRQIRALEYEKKTGKPYSEGDVVVDAEYEEFQKSLGIIKDG